MQLRDLLGDDSAVSPVIGVILMVAITVILAAVIGTFVLGLGDQVSSSNPQASFSFDLDTSSSTEDATSSSALQDSGSDNALTITHDGGDEIDGTQLSVTDGGSTIPYSASSGNDFDVDPVSAGTSVTTQVDQSDTVRIIWESPNGGDTATLGKWDGPDA